MNCPDSILHQPWESDGIELWLDHMCGDIFRAHIKSNYSVCPPGGDGKWIFRCRQDDEFTSNKWKVATEHLMKHVSILSIEGIMLQFWRATTFNGRQLLTASNQPFMLWEILQFNKGLCEYRMICEDHQVYVDGESEEEHLGPLGRVFCLKLPEWTPHVQNYSTKDHPLRNDALRCNIALSLVLPIIEPSDQSSVGVIELVTTKEDSLWRMPKVVGHICRALKEVNLTTSKGLDGEDLEVCRESHKHVVDEISKVLSVVCQTYKLPLAQTWIRCRHYFVIARDGGLHESCNMFDSQCIGNACMRLIDEAFYVDGFYEGFREACVDEVIMRRNNGVAGWALSSHRSCLCGDITRFTPAEYAFVDEACQCELTSCFAICLRSTHTADDEYILEFFLPPMITDSGLQLNLVDSILARMKQNSVCLRDASGRELEERFSGEVIEVKICSTLRSLPRSEALQPGAELVRLDSSDDDLMPEVIKTTRSPQRPEAALQPGADSSVEGLMVEVIGTMRSPQRPEAALQPGAELVSLDSSDKDLMVEVNAVNSEMKVVTLAGISFSYEFLQQHFGKTLEDTAEDIGVSRSTLKRACRLLDISNWRNCKRKKINHSISKLNMNESVRGTEGEGSSMQPKIAAEGMLKLTRMDSSDSVPPKQLAVASVTSTTTPKIPVLQDVRSVTIKATYGDDVIIKFELSSSSRLEDLRKEVTERLELEPHSFRIKYQDEDGDWILIACDKDLRCLMDTPTSLERTTIRMLVQLVSS